MPVDLQQSITLILTLIKWTPTTALQYTTHSCQRREASVHSVSWQRSQPRDGGTDPLTPLCRLAAGWYRWQKRQRFELRPGQELQEAHKSPVTKPKLPSESSRGSTLNITIHWEGLPYLFALLICVSDSEPFSFVSPL